MLANPSNAVAASGSLNRDVHQPASFRYELLAFIADQLPRWRDRPERKREVPETILTSQLCAHLNGAARHSDGWDVLQFRVEEPDEQRRSRKVDLVPAPCGATVWIEGRRYSDFDPLLPIECKRLPTPQEKDRDEREYVFSKYSTTGGVQRFKAGHHGAAHTLGAMIAYVQGETIGHWHQRTTEWISGLVKSGQRGWSNADVLEIVCTDANLKLSVLRSSHDREDGRSRIEIRHLWIEMN